VSHLRSPFYYVTAAAPTARIWYRNVAAFETRCPSLHPWPRPASFVR